MTARKNRNQKPDLARSKKLKSIIKRMGTGNISPESTVYRGECGPSAKVRQACLVEFNEHDAGIRQIEVTFPDRTILTFSEDGNRATDAWSPSSKISPFTRVARARRAIWDVAAQIGREQGQRLGCRTRRRRK